LCSPVFWTKANPGDLDVEYTWKDQVLAVNPLTTNDPYSGRTASLTSKRSILYIYSTNIDTEYFKHSIYSPFFFSSKCSLFHNSNVFGSCIIHILCTECAKIKKKTLYTLSVFSSSKCSLFHNSNVFGSCIIHILYTGCAKIKKNIVYTLRFFLFKMQFVS